jgi:hypothetical protein
LDHPAELLAQGMGRQLNLIVVRRPAPLLQPLQLRRHRRCLLQQIFELSL